MVEQSREYFDDLLCVTYYWVRTRVQVYYWEWRIIEGRPVAIEFTLFYNIRPATIKVIYTSLKSFRSISTMSRFTMETGLLLHSTFHVLLSWIPVLSLRFSRTRILSLSYGVEGQEQRLTGQNHKPSIRKWTWPVHTHDAQSSIPYTVLRPRWTESIRTPSPS